MNRTGRYEIIDELGRGAMGVVYRARDPKFDRQVAIKTIKKIEDHDDDTRTEYLERFNREARTAGKLTHPGILTIFDADEAEDGTPYIVMELVTGTPLDVYLKQGRRFQETEVLNMMIQVADALDFAHREQIVHRDIKPANLIRLDSGQMKIMDFGIAKIADSELTQGGIALGSPSYMSPEQLTGGHLDGRSDLFSLGVTIYQLLTGERPFAGDNLQAVSYRIMNDDPVPPSKVNPQLQLPWDRVLERLLAKNSRDRFNTAGELRAVLEAMRDGRPIDALLIGGEELDATMPAGAAIDVTQPVDRTRSPVDPMEQTVSQLIGAAANKVVRKPLTKIVLILIVLGAIGGGVAVYLSMDSHISKAQRYMREGNHRLAIQHIKEAQAQPENARNTELVRMLITSYYQLQEDELLFAAIQRLHRLDDSTRSVEEINRMLVDLFADERLGEEVYAYYRDVVQVAGQKTLQSVAFTHDNAEVRWKAASILLEWGVRPQPAKWLQLVQWFIQNDQAERAYQLAERMDHLNPGDPDVVHARVTTACALDRSAQCLLNLKALLSLDPERADHPDLMRALLTLLSQPEQHDEAFKILRDRVGEKAEEPLRDIVATASPEKALLAGRLLGELGLPIEAEPVMVRLKQAYDAGEMELANSLAELLPKGQGASPEVEYWRAMIEYRLGNKSSAFQRLRRLADDHPEYRKDERILEIVLSELTRPELPKDVIPIAEQFPTIKQRFRADLDHKQREKRAHAVRVLQALGEKVDYAVVYKRELASDDHDKRWWAVGQIEKNGGKVDLVPILIKDLEEQACKVRRSAVERLGKLGDPRARKPLKALQEKVSTWETLTCFGESIDEALAKIK